jgi:hypothetical protein
MRPRTRLAFAAALAGLVGMALPAGGTVDAAADAHESPIPRGELREVKRATARYHSLRTARADGFSAFSLDPNNPDVPTCFDSPDGGMGVHFVRHIDDVLDPNHPEALVYEVKRKGRVKLVAVEYIVPEEFVDPDDPPMLFGEVLHHHPFLPVYILHAWIWKANPDGVFADFNPRVDACPG